MDYTETEFEQEEQTMKKVLYLDDVSYALASIKERLKNDYEIYPTLSVGKMFEILDKVKIDLIILDVNMPDADGFEAIQKIKADNRYENIPVLFLTAQKDREKLIKGIRLGAVDFITKPISNEKLISHINYHLDPEKRAATKPIILAIDDMPSILHAINEILSKHYIVYTMPEVKTEHVLREVLRRTTPDLFILDFRMPGLTGFDLVPVIRSIEEHEETPIVFLTSENSVENITAAVKLGACDYITKPIDDAVLLKKLQMHLKDFVIRRRIRSLNETGYPSRKES
jgi:DNA-binding response OmpR family regulator